jgi:hypothetical protein
MARPRPAPFPFPAGLDSIRDVPVSAKDAVAPPIISAPRAAHPKESDGIRFPDPVTPDSRPRLPFIGKAESLL